MKSIRRTISVWMIPGLAIIWTIGGIAVYRTYRSAILSSIDSENLALSRLVRSEHRPQGRGGGGGPAWNRGESARSTPTVLSEDGLFYQVWSPDGTPLAKSENLGSNDLPMPELDGESIFGKTTVMPTELRLRVMGIGYGLGRHGGSNSSFGPPAHAGGGEGQAVIIAVARDLTETDSRLMQAVLVIVGVGVLMVGGMLLLLRLALRSGLRPLELLGEAVSDVDPSSLNARFSTGDEPLELRPIVSHLDRLMDRVESGFLRERRFGADLAHELRTPIAEMRTKLDLAQKWPEEQNDEWFQNTREITLRMQGVVGSMLQLAQLEGDGGNFEAVKVPLGPIVTEAWKPHLDTVRDKRLKVTVDCPEEEEASGDPDLWSHILSNLISNAVEYTPVGGGIRLSVEKDVLRLSNKVVNLDKEKVRQMFDRFWRADGSRTDSLHSGLGLSLVRACAHAMGVEVSASLEEMEDGDQLVLSVSLR